MSIGRSIVRPRKERTKMWWRVDEQANIIAPIAQSWVVRASGPYWAEKEVRWRLKEKGRIRVPLRVHYVGMA